MQPYDLVIVGGGLIGGSLACALADTGLRIALVEAVAADAALQPSYDERVIALSWGSRRILEAIGLWGAVAPEAEPIRRIHVSERGQCGITRLDQAELGVDALGYVVPARALGAAIRPTLDGLPGIDLLCPARLVGLRVQGDLVALQVEGHDGLIELRSRLVVAADGGDSAVRRAQGITVEEQPYGHDAIITTITPDRPRPGWAFERFTDTGPLAMLPMTAGRWSVVWTCREQETAGLLALPDDAFLARLQGRFGYRLGRLGLAAPRRAYPLKLLLTRETIHPRLVLIGNAAHTLHPVAGQGFNLGLRDVAALAEVLAEAATRGEDPGAPAVLAAYRQWRGPDQQTTAALTDTLARLFVNPWLPLRLARNLGLLGLDLLPPARRSVARRFMGQGGRTPRLARGLPLGAGRTARLEP
ncbi:2-octaprenyl-6-methoxyphenyl hydroxylase [Candidatus Thiodictyon syntrophicum]|jgi:2-octaprenyl-6-methoxyphenol hydroxylase|uniref:2-octaprenyl-6-methoxyphenyl hydroxylase n=1 Tax=Candidatus Thiodictyon syntrophicum TaxID=1166950 RepID=A0A2K8U2X8_9GAMM|nr:2-octaprenyl-6-methoxyphenyl hydroxylase [Candidatus Thiodictyon syntrophicum]AUB79897.1 2-octaprenyl-6-methoxyphenyl hydroxylase [Candidatus Thiodictyon syntrophicum]